MQRMYDSNEKVSYVNVEDHLDDKATSQDTRGFVLVICQLPRSTIQGPAIIVSFTMGGFKLQGSRCSVQNPTRLLINGECNQSGRVEGSCPLARITKKVGISHMYFLHICIRGLIA